MTDRRQARFLPVATDMNGGDRLFPDEMRALGYSLETIKTIWPPEAMSRVGYDDESIRDFWPDWAPETTVGRIMWPPVLFLGLLAVGVIAWAVVHFLGWGGLIGRALQ